VRIEELQARIPEREMRAFPLQIEVRDVESGVGTIAGHAAVFNSETVIADTFREVVRPGAFTKTLGEHADVRALQNHDHNLVLGRTKSGTLRVGQDETGLAIEGDLPDTTYARDLAVVMRRGDVDQMSFWFRKIKDRWSEERDKLPLRELLEVELLDVSVVTFPYYPATDASLRGLVEHARGGGKLTPEEREMVSELLGVKLDEPGKAPHSDDAVPAPDPIRADQSRRMDQALRIAESKRWLTQRGNAR
jgi:hypothetical protein